MTVTKPATFRRSQGVVALARARLRASGRARFGRLGAWAVVLGFAIMAVALRAEGGADASLADVVAGAARWVAWLAGAPLALAAAEDHAARDRRDGILALVAPRGISTAGLASARALAAMMEIARAIAVPLLLLAALTAGLAGRGRAVLESAGAGAGVVAFALVAGVTLGGLGAACGRIGRARGQRLLLGIVVLPWLLADLAGHGAWSIPGALAAVLDFALRAGSAGA